MGALTSILLGLALTGCVHAPRQMDKGLASALTTQEGLSEALAPRRYAVIIGVDAYEDPTFPALRWAGKDATDLAALLRAQQGGGFDDVRVLDGPDATRREVILRTLLTLKQSLRREDQLVVYFSGHGTRVLGDDEKWHGYLLAADSRAANLPSTGLDLEQLQSWFSSLPVDKKALIVDACFAGEGKSVAPPTTIAGAAPPEDPLIPRQYALGPGEAQLFATTEGRPSREDDRLGHGVYTGFLLEALSWGAPQADLDRDGVVTIYEAHDYARGRTIAYTDHAQIPEAAFRVVGADDLVLAGDPTHRKAREMASLFVDSRGGLASATVTVDGRDRGVFPEHVVVEAGRHHLVLHDPLGNVLVDGYATLQPGSRVQVEDLARVVQGPKGALSLRGALIASPALPAVIGSSSEGVEASLLSRVNRGPARGLYGEAIIGAALSPKRTIDGVPTAQLRTLGWGALDTGWQNDFQRLRVRLGVGVSGALIPPQLSQVYGGHPDPTQVPSEAGWWLLAAGPNLGVGYVLSEGWTLTANTRLHASWLDVDGDGRAALVPWTTTSLGVEVAW